MVAIMKPRNQGAESIFYSIKIFKNDLKDIESILKELNPTAGLKILTQKMEYEYVDELPSNAEVLSYFEMVYEEPKVKLVVNGLSAILSGSSLSALPELGAFKKIEAILKKSERLPQKIVGQVFMSRPALMIYTLIYIQCLFVFVIPHFQKYVLPYLQKLPILLFSLAIAILYFVPALGIIFLVNYLFYYFSRSQIILQNKENRPSFFIRKRDDLIAGLLLTALGVALGILGSKLF
jgi:hypothetical protein